MNVTRRVEGATEGVGCKKEADVGSVMTTPGPRCDAGALGRVPDMPTLRCNRFYAVKRPTLHRSHAVMRGGHRVHGPCALRGSREGRMRGKDQRVDV